MTYEYHALEADTLPQPEQLNEFGKDGWRIVQFIEIVRDGEHGWLIYMIREKMVTQ